MTINRCTTCAVALTAVLASTGLAKAAPGDYTFINIADNTGELGNAFFNPCINASGTVGFGASIGGGEVGIFTGNGGLLTPIVLGDDDTVVSSFIDINDSGFVCMRVQESVLKEGIYVGNGGPLTLIVFTDDNPFQSVGLPVLNNGGAVSFIGTDSVGTTGIHRADSPGNFTTIVEEGGDIVSLTGRSVINDSGLVAFNANTSSGAFIAAGDGGPLTTIVETGPDYPSLGSVVSMNNSGDFAFFAGDGQLQGVYVASGGSITTIADSSANFQPFTFNDICLNDNGDVAFYAFELNSTRGLFTGPDPDADKVIQVGDQLFGSTVTGFSALIGPNAINNDGDICFVYFLDDGRTGVALAQAAGVASPPGDLNGDLVVDVSDLLQLISAWGPCPQPCPPSCVEDINGDCNVAVEDLLELLANWS